MLRIALFLALVAGASATSDYPGTATCELLKKSNYCDMIDWVAAVNGVTTSGWCSCDPLDVLKCADTAAMPAKANGCAMDSGSCNLKDKTGLDTKTYPFASNWFSDDQKKCTALIGANFAADETKCKEIAGCVYTKPAGVAGGACYPTSDSVVATATGKGATAVQLAHLKMSMHNDVVCGPIAKDEATCNADLRCAYNKADKTCKTSIFYLVHTLDSGGCTTEAADMAKLYDVDVAQANAISTGGAAGFSKYAVVVSALVAALSLIA